MEDEREYTFTKPENLRAHYTTAAVAFEHVLPERRLRMSPYRVMRDVRRRRKRRCAAPFRRKQPCRVAFVGR